MSRTPASGYTSQAVSFGVALSSIAAARRAAESAFLRAIQLSAVAPSKHNREGPAFDRSNLPSRRVGKAAARLPQDALRQREACATVESEGSCFAVLANESHP